MSDGNERQREDNPTTFNLFEEQYDCIRAGDVESLDEFIKSGAIREYNHRIMTDVATARDMFMFNLAHCHAIATEAGIASAEMNAIVRKNIAFCRRETDIDRFAEVIGEVMLVFAALVHSRSREVASKQVREAKDYIAGHVYEQIRVSDIADHCFMSVSGLEHRFKRETGESVTEAIQRVKVNKACQLLRREDMSCTEIAHKLGYCSQSYFITRFKAVVGMTPLKYRKSVETLSDGNTGGVPGADGNNLLRREAQLDGMMPSSNTGDVE